MTTDTKEPTPRYAEHVITSICLEAKQLEDSLRSLSGLGWGEYYTDSPENAQIVRRHRALVEQAKALTDEIRQRVKEVRAAK